MSLARVRWGRIGLLLILVAGVALAAFAPLKAWLLAMDAWFLALGPWGPPALVLLFVVWGLAMPPSPVQLLAAALYGVWGGIAVTYAGALLNLWAHLLLARRWARDGRLEQLYLRRPRLRALERAVVEQGWYGVVLLRLSNLMPSYLVNVLLGCTTLSRWTITWASCVGKLPGIVMLALLGSASARALRAGEEASNPWAWAGIGAAIIASLVLGVVLARAAKRHYRAMESEDSLDWPMG
ncbi:MAG: TVP38/TMEM64 family protein [Planctomycetota bacterium]|jgi:uncharacterized membrane protein YdjX (TVP38/TMEM64 family)